MSDPINPAHYDGTACAQIGERLTGNSYQVLKYNWRLGKKDDPLIEIGKSIWYLDREIMLAHMGLLPAPAQGVVSLPDDMWFRSKLIGVDDYVEMVAWALISWNQHGDRDTLTHLRQSILRHRADFETLSTGQHTMEV